jgi:exonuclease SbcD
MPPIRLLHIADIHIGMENYGRLDPQTGANSRVMDFVRRLDDAVQYALDSEIDIFLFAGDAFKTRDPSPTYQREFARRIKQVADAGIPVVLLVGNHDLPVAERRATSTEIFRTLAVPNVYYANKDDLLTIMTRRGAPLQVATVPYPLRARLMKQEDGRSIPLPELDARLEEIVNDSIRALADRARQHPDLPTVFTGHFTVRDAQFGSERSVMLGADAVIPKSALADDAWDYVALGHIHRHQDVNKGRYPSIVYCGSLERIDFNEMESKGWVEAEVEKGHTTWRFVSHYKTPARPFVVVRADLREMENGDPTKAVVAAIAGQDLNGAVVKVKLDLLAEQEPQLRDKELLDALEKAGIFYLAAIEKTVERHDRMRLDGGSVASLTPAKLLEAYLQQKNLPPERIAQLLAAAQGIMEGRMDGE